MSLKWSQTQKIIQNFEHIIECMVKNYNPFPSHLSLFAVSENCQEKAKSILVWQSIQRRWWHNSNLTLRKSIVISLFPPAAVLPFSLLRGTFDFVVFSFILVPVSRLSAAAAAGLQVDHYMALQLTLIKMFVCPSWGPLPSFGNP